MKTDMDIPQEDAVEVEAQANIMEKGTCCLCGALSYWAPAAEITALTATCASLEQSLETTNQKLVCSLFTSLW